MGSASVGRGKGVGGLKASQTVTPTMHIACVDISEVAIHRDSMLGLKPQETFTPNSFFAKTKRHEPFWGAAPISIQ